MSEEADNTGTIEPPASNQHQTTTKPTSSSFSIWPPTKRTRDAVRTRLIETLVDPSVLSKRYIAVSGEEALELSERIEEEAFHVAGGDAVGVEGDGIDILKVYSKEISGKMLDVLKAKSSESDAGERAVDAGSTVG